MESQGDRNHRAGYRDHVVIYSADRENSVTTGVRKGSLRPRSSGLDTQEQSEEGKRKTGLLLEALQSHVDERSFVTLVHPDSWLFEISLEEKAPRIQISEK